MRGALWWIDRWRQSTAYTDQTAEEQGLYRNLLDEVWIRPDHVIPDDPRILARVSGDPEAWARCSAKVLTWFERTEGGWTHAVALEVIRQSERRADKQRRYRERGAVRSGNANGNGSGNADGNGARNKPGSPFTAHSSQETGEGTGKARRQLARAASILSSLEWIEHDPEDELEAALASRVVQLELADAAREGREPGPEGARDILAAVSATRKGAQITGRLQDVKRNWIRTSLAACDLFAEDNGLSGLEVKCSVA